MCPVMCPLCVDRMGRHSFEHRLEGSFGCELQERAYTVLWSHGVGFVRHRPLTGSELI